MPAGKIGTIYGATGIAYLIDEKKEMSIASVEMG